MCFTLLKMHATKYKFKFNLIQDRNSLNIPDKYLQERMFRETENSRRDLLSDTTLFFEHEVQSQLYRF